MDKDSCKNAGGKKGGGAPWARLFFLGVSVVLSLAAGLLIAAPEPAGALARHSVYWTLLITFAVFTAALLPSAKSFIRQFQLDRKDARALAAGAALSVFLLAHEEAGHKVVQDENVQTAAAMSLHLHRDGAAPQRAYEAGGQFFVFDAYLDKRPFFFPFLLCLAHDLTGCRPENAFYLNGLLTVILMGLVYLLGRIFGGGVKGGLLCCLLLAGLPVLGQAANSAGFSVLNLVMIALVMLLGALVMKDPAPVSIICFVYGGVLLAQTRYESVIFVFPVILILIRVWRCERKIVIPRALIPVPLLMTHMLLQFRAVRHKSFVWQLDERQIPPFGLDYVRGNIGHAARFFFNAGHAQPNSLMLLLMGGFGLFIAAAVLKRHRRGFRWGGPPGAALLLFTLGLLAVNMVIMCYYWGRFDTYASHRLALPACLLLLCPGVVTLCAFIRGGKAWVFCFSLAAFGLFHQGIPVMSAERKSEDAVTAAIENWKADFFRKRGGEYFLWIDRFPFTSLARSKPSISWKAARGHLDRLNYHYKTGTFENVYAFQILVPDETGVWREADYFRAPPEMVLEPSAEKAFGLFLLARVSRVAEIRRGFIPLKELDLRAEPPNVENGPADPSFLWLKSLP